MDEYLNAILKTAAMFSLSGRDVRRRKKFNEE